MKRIAFAAVTLVGFAVILWSGPASAANPPSPEITIAPPPLAYPDYSDPDKFQGRAGATYINVSGTDVSITGLGGNITARKVLPKTSGGLNEGISFSGALVGLTGTVASSSVSGLATTVAGNYEIETWKGEAANLILFLGPQYNYTYVHVAASGADVDVYAPLFGYQAGVQYTAQNGNFKFSPWFQYTHLSGTVSATVTSSASGRSQTEDSTVNVNSSALGLDFLHVPSAMTLSSLYQQQSGGDTSLRTLILQFTWGFGEGVPKEKAATAPQAEPKSQ